MKLPLSIQTKQTIRLFNGKYKYKIVLLSKAASWFRGNDHLTVVKKGLDSADTNSISWVRKLTLADKNYVLKLLTAMTTMSEYSIRVESPYINFYTNNANDVEKLAKINSENVKYVSLPVPGSENLLDDKKVLVKNLNYAYKVNKNALHSLFNCIVPTFMLSTYSLVAFNVH
jgi:hypothetical protein